MKISYRWLCDYLPQEISVEETAKILTSIGLEVEHIAPFEKVKGGLQGLLVGKVITCVPHPNADKLKLTTVDIGKEALLHIVCGAPNVAAGQKVIVAPVGSTLYPTKGDAFEIKKAKIRGEVSEGMLCAEDEIGIGESHDGIIILDEKATIGTKASEYYNIEQSDFIFEIGLTPNRMDSMSHLGVAKDVCAYLTNKSLQKVTLIHPDNSVPKSLQPNPINIIIQDQTFCKRYAGVVISGITVGPSPEWLQKKLQAIGVKTINNVVDITNFVLHEMGQPLHAFDVDAIAGNQIIVRRALQNETFLTLDNQTIKLHTDDGMISNANSPMCIAGIFGGAESGIKETSTNIFIESAYFDAVSIRKSSMRHELRTEAAARFEKGADIDKVIPALYRAASLILSCCGGTCSEVIDIYPAPLPSRYVTVSIEKINKLAGKNYTKQQIELILTALNFGIEKSSDNELTLRVPNANPDIEMTADIVEEIMRIDGLDEIPFTGKLQYALPTGTTYKQPIKQQLTQALVAKGFYELFTNSITNTSYYSPDESHVIMLNSLSANLNMMRPEMLETALESITYNLNRKNTELKFFEFGKTYRQLKKQDQFNFIEEEHLLILATGHYNTIHFSEKSKPIDEYYIKGIIESVIPIIGLEYEQHEHTLAITLNGKQIGILGTVSEKQRNTFDIKQPVIYADLNWTVVRNALSNQKIRYKEISKYPPVERDLSLIVNQDTSYNEIEQAVRKAGSQYLQKVHLFDFFKNEKIGQDKKSLALRLTFSTADKTLTDTEIEENVSKIIKNIEHKTGARIRKETQPH